VALAALWRSWGVHPHAVVGHSMGEVAAAHVAGVLDLADAVRVICRRSQLLRPLSGRGAMAVVQLPLDQARAALAGHEDRLAIAVSNSPTSTVLSGDPAALATVMEALQARNVFCRAVKVDVASHSPQVDPLRGPLLAALRELAPGAGSLPMYSTVTGRVIEGRTLDAEYWVRNLRDPVLFWDAVQRLVADEHDVFVEISPHPVLVSAVEQGLHQLGRGRRTLPSLRRGVEERRALLESLGELYTLGVPLEWPAVFRAGERIVRVPSYPWQRRRFHLAGAGPVTPRTAPEAADEAPVDPAGWLYEMAWRPRQHGGSAPAGAGVGDHWVILADEGGIGEALAMRLEIQGRYCTVLRRSLDAEGIRQAAAALGEGPCRGVVYLWALDNPGSADGSEPGSAFARDCGSVLDLVRAITALPAPQRPHLWVATAGAQPLGERRDLTLHGAPLWGLGRGLSLEHPELWGGLVDLDPDMVGDSVEALAAEILMPDGEDQVAYRRGQRYVARFLPAAQPLGQSRLAVRGQEATYLIVGGLGGLGLLIADWLVDRGARSLVLTSRQGLPPRERWDAEPVETGVGQQIARVRALQARGARVTVLAVDVGDREGMQAALEQVRRELPPLRGIVHAAGVAMERPAAELDAAALGAVARAKVQGAWTLHELTADLDLDVFVLFSSAAAIWGARGLAHYAAANQFLDALAHYRRARGLPALSVNWGWWSGGGIATASMQQVFAQVGLRPMPGAAALTILAALLEGGAVQKTVADVDWTVFKAVYEASRCRPLLEEILPPAAPAPVSPSPAAPLARRLGGATPEEGRQILLAAVQEEVAHVLGLDPSEPMDPRTGFFKMGMKSLMTVELRNRLQSRLGRPLPPTLAFEYPTVESLAAFLAGEVFGSRPADLASSGSRPNGKPAAETPDDGALSEDELTALLAAKLKEIR
jgi:epothilone polyketide synthase E